MYNSDNIQTVEVKLTMDINKDFVDEFKSIVDHHIEYLIDINNFPEILSIYDCKVVNK